MATEFLNCPHCNTLIPSNSMSCPSCRRPIERCGRCEHFLYSGRANCLRCGAFVAKEPRIRANAWLEGGDTVGDERVLRIRIENSGNILSNANLLIQLPKSMKPNEFADSIENIRPLTFTDRSFTFIAESPGQYSLDKIKITYMKSSGDEETFTLKPMPFVVYGRPKIQLLVKPSTNTVKLGEIAEYFVVLTNNGTENAASIRVNIRIPQGLISLDPSILLNYLKVGEGRVALIRVRPVVSGNYSCTIKTVYSSPIIRQRKITTFETPTKTITLNAVWEKSKEKMNL